MALLFFGTMFQIQIIWFQQCLFPYVDRKDKQWTMFKYMNLENKHNWIKILIYVGVSFTVKKVMKYSIIVFFHKDNLKYLKGTLQNISLVNKGILNFLK